MTTVVDPLGTPSVTFNKSGVSIATIETDGSSWPLPSLPGETKVYLVSTTGSNIHPILPAGVDIGDVVEAVSLDGSPGNDIGTASGESFVNIVPSDRTLAPFTSSITVRKVSSTGWAIIAFA
jgi:hypothetical protein